MTIHVLKKNICSFCWGNEQKVKSHVPSRAFTCVYVKGCLIPPLGALGPPRLIQRCDQWVQTEVLT